MSRCWMSVNNEDQHDTFIGAQNSFLKARRESFKENCLRSLKHVRRYPRLLDFGD